MMLILISNCVSVLGKCGSEISKNNERVTGAACTKREGPKDPKGSDSDDKDSQIHTVADTSERMKMVEAILIEEEKEKALEEAFRSTPLSLASEPCRPGYRP